jgi:hypothetical protein
MERIVELLKSNDVELMNLGLLLLQETNDKEDIINMMKAAVVEPNWWYDSSHPNSVTFYKDGNLYIMSTEDKLQIIRVEALRGEVYYDEER